MEGVHHLCCGHGEGGKLCPTYQAMARRLARQGAFVIVPDNIGQGERTPMGHHDCVVPFACGISVQGLIVMETLGWIAWAKANPRMDPSRIAAIGNSGGGTLTLFLAALNPDLCAIASSGYPSTFEFIARKEKKHCHCNLLPGVVGQIEMWQLYGLFAPRPLFLCQGDQDSLFPSDIFFSTARKVKTAYDAIGTAAGFRSNVFSGEHPWDTRRRFAIGSFLAEAIGLRAAESLDNDSAGDIATPCFDTWPTAALSTDDLARRLTGKNPAPDMRLWDVFRPRIDPAAAVPVTPRGDTLQILAQYECFLADGNRAV